MYFVLFKNKNINFTKTDQTEVEIFDNSNTYHYIYSNLVNDGISKLKKSLLFYELIELFIHIQSINSFKYINVGDFSNTECFKDFVEYKLTKYKYYRLKFDEIKQTNFDLLFFNTCHFHIFYIIHIICKYQTKNGYTIIKTNTKNIHFLYLLTSLFTKTIICKPDVMNDNENYYIICQKFNNTYNYDIGRIVFENNVECVVPYHFINYMNEIFVLMKQQILLYNKNVFFLKNINVEKMEQIRNKNIYQCIKWCETHSIPFNQIKINIFNDKLK
jgi:hypothetical protein